MLRGQMSGVNRIRLQEDLCELPSTKRRVEGKKPCGGGHGEGWGYHHDCCCCYYSYG